MMRGPRLGPTFASTALLLLLGCGGEDAPGNTSGTSTAYVSTLCPELSGMEAIAWDLYGGVIVTDPVLPPPAPSGATYGHPDLPLLGFSYPAGWTPTSIRGQGVVGVDLVRDDQRALWRTVSGPAQVGTTAEGVATAELEGTRAFFGLSAGGTEVCRHRASGEASPGTGILATLDHRLVRIDGQTTIVAVQVTTVSPTLAPSVSVRTVSAPTAEMADRVYDTFLAIDWQLLYGGGSNENDRDGDGVWDVFDAFPDDPDRS